jgi:hypothetical protein
MGQRQAAFGHHLHQVSQAELEAKIPAHAQDDDLAVKVATLEQLFDAHQLAHAHPSGSSADIIAGQILPFAPEPFNVPDEVWRHYVPPDQRGHMVCLACWDVLVDVTDRGAYQNEHGGPLALWSPEWRKRRGVSDDEPAPPWMRRLGEG